MIAKVFSKIVGSKGFYIDSRDLLREVDLSNIESNMLGLLDEFFKKYERMPTREEMLLFLGELPDSEQKFIADYKSYINEAYKVDSALNIDDKVLLTELREQANKQRIKHEIVRIADTFDARSSKEITESLQKLLFSNQEGNRERRIEVDTGNVQKNIPLIKYRDTERIPTMIKGLDRMTYGGPGMRELWCIIAPSGRGKSAFFVNLMHGFMVQGISVLYVTLEMGVVDILRRLYRRVLYKDKDFLRDGNEDTMMTWLNRFFGIPGASGKIVYFPANSFSAEDLKMELMKLEMRGGFIPQVILIDHLDLMTSRTKSIRQKEGFSYWRLIVDDLREIPLTRGVPIITATQSNRDSSKKVLVGVMDVGESYGKVQSSDVVLSLNQTPDEVLLKRMRVAVLKNRDYYAGMEAEIFCDLNLMTMCDLQFAQTNGWL
jgi:archaellum biogenesis ATPase FlaH